MAKILMFSHILLLCSFISPAMNPVWAAASKTPIESKILTVEHAVASALNLSPENIAAKNQLAAADIESKNAFATFLPSIDLSTSHGLRGVNPDTTGLTSETPYVSSANLSLTENLYDNGASLKKYRIAKLKFEMAKINFQKTKAAVIKNVLLAYFRHNLSLQNLEFTKKNCTELERLAKLVSDQFHQGMKMRKDYLSFKTKAQRGRLEVIAAEKIMTKSRAALLATIGLSPNDCVQFDERVKPVIPKNKTISAIDIGELYESEMLDLHRQISRLEVDLAKRRYWPELDVVGTASYGSSSYLDTQQSWADNDSTEWSVLLNLKVNLLDWGTRSRNVQLAAIDQSSGEQTYRTRLMEAQNEFELFKLEVVRSAESYRLAKELQKMEEDTFKLLERDYRSGHATYLELSTGLANLLDAQSRGQEADYEQADLYLRWKYYKGILSEKTIFE